MNHDVNKAPNSPAAASSERPTYEPPALIDCGTVAALTLGSGSTYGSDAWGAGGAGGGS
jgi:hypothetical protein